MADRKRGPEMVPGLDRLPCLCLLLTIDSFIPVSISASQRITHLRENVKRPVMGSAILNMAAWYNVEQQSMR
jgi:hypothetical protein